MPLDILGLTILKTSDMDDLVYTLEEYRKELNEWHDDWCEREKEVLEIIHERDNLRATVDNLESIINTLEAEKSAEKKRFRNERESLNGRVSVLQDMLRNAKVGDEMVHYKRE